MKNDVLPKTWKQNQDGTPAKSIPALPASSKAGDPSPVLSNPQSGPAVPGAGESGSEPLVVPSPAAGPAPPSEVELYLQHLKCEIEDKEYVFGGLLTISGSLLTDTPRFLRANGNPKVKPDAREFAVLAILAWHAFKVGRISGPTMLEPNGLLPIEDFLAVEDILFLIGDLKRRHSSISVLSADDANRIHDVVNRLRRKLERATTHRKLIETGPTGGYRLSLPPQHLQLLLDGDAYGRRDV